MLRYVRPEHVRASLYRQADGWLAGARYQDELGDNAWNAGRHQEATVYYTNARRARREAERLERLAEEREDDGQSELPL